MWSTRRTSNGIDKKTPTQSKVATITEKQTPVAKLELLKKHRDKIEDYSLYFLFSPPEKFKLQ